MKHSTETKLKHAVNLLRVFGIIEEKDKLKLLRQIKRYKKNIDEFDENRIVSYEQL